MYSVMSAFCFSTHCLLDSPVLLGVAVAPAVSLDLHILTALLLHIYVLSSVCVGGGAGIVNRASVSMTVPGFR